MFNHLNDANGENWFRDDHGNAKWNCVMAEPWRCKALTREQCRHSSACLLIHGTEESEWKCLWARNGCEGIQGTRSDTEHRCRRKPACVVHLDRRGVVCALKQGMDRIGFATPLEDPKTL